jgi:hypothetical protein
LSQLTEYSLGDTLVPNGLLGYRFWLNYNGRLTALHNRYVWEPGVNQASCGGNPLIRRPTKMAHNFDPSCSCGFYARYFPEDLLDMSATSNLNSVVGVIEATGRVAHGTRGFKAEKARILAICPVSTLLHPSKKTLPIMAGYYGVPLLRNMEEIVRHFPPDDVSDLINSIQPQVGNELLQQQIEQLSALTRTNITSLCTEIKDLMQATSVTTTNGTITSVTTPNGTIIQNFGA